MLYEILDKESPISNCIVSEDTSSADEIMELLLDIASIQNANGSFMEDGKKTAYFVIAMILYNEENRQYKNQINKAINYLLSSVHNDLTVYLALKLAYAKGYRNNNLYPIISFIEDADALGNYKHLFNLLNKNIMEFTSILFNESLDRKQLIKFLFKKI